MNGIKIASKIPMIDIIIDTKENILDIHLLSTRFDVPILE